MAWQKNQLTGPYLQTTFQMYQEGITRDEENLFQQLYSQIIFFEK